MATLYLIYGVPNSGKKETIETLPSGMFANDSINIINEPSYEEERESIKYFLKKGEDAVLDIYNAMPSVFESWFDFINKLGHKVKVILMSTPLDKILEANKNSDEPIEIKNMQALYNNYVETTGWLYLNHRFRIINSEHLQ